MRLAIVTHRLACRRDAGADRAFRDDPPVPDLGQTLVPAHQPPGIAHQQVQQVEHLRLKRNRGASPQQNVPPGIQDAIGKDIAHG
nr:hypothetical protein [Ruegeria pomeroyi]